MNKCSSVFGQILQIFNRYEFERMVKKTHSEKGTKGFSSWDQFVAMLFCQLGQAHSLREICGGLATCLKKNKTLRSERSSPPVKTGLFMRTSTLKSSTKTCSIHY